MKKISTAGSAGEPQSSALPRSILRLPAVIQRCGMKRSSIYLWMSKGLFPKAKRIGSRAVGWDSKEIDAWVNAQLDGRTWKPEGE
jgi:prophage regulatory protein